MGKKNFPHYQKRNKPSMGIFGGVSTILQRACAPKALSQAFSTPCVKMIHGARVLDMEGGRPREPGTARHVIVMGTEPPIRMLSQKTASVECADTAQ
jgi:hypothetical protein